MFYIYALLDPRNNSVYYIGMSKNPEQRQKDYEKCTHENSYASHNPFLVDWLVTLREQNLKPFFLVLQTTQDRKLAYIAEGQI